MCVMVPVSTSKHCDVYILYGHNMSASLSFISWFLGFQNNITSLIVDTYVFAKVTNCFIALLGVVDFTCDVITIFFLNLFFCHTSDNITSLRLVIFCYKF